MCKIKHIICIGLLLASTSYSQELVWKSKSELPKPMRGTAVTCGNSIYFMEANTKSSEVYEYNPITDTWKYKALMITPGWNLNLAEVDGMIFAIGGDPFRDRNELYNPASNTWKTLSSMPTARQHTNCCVVNNKIYVIGGLEKGDMKKDDGMEHWAEKAKLSDKNEAYDPKLNKWETRAPLPTPRQGPGIGVIQNKIYAIGGLKTSAYNSPFSQVVEVYDTSTDTWERKSDFPISIVTHGVVTHNNKLFVIGGQTLDKNRRNHPIANVYYYDEENDKWLRTTDLPNPIQIVSTAASNGCIYVIGGCDHTYKPLQNVWCGQIEK